ncbi:hypothetical protein HN419_03355 [Candidatus Woesearchaeota archaeon]|jgi:hypothetical protein|nr:hypothetical protein [Candidatus Woesearchaeota archaeon]MBT3536966.1 hypothetical protein [Candidatus Woesearchaeota archaeon]MBT4697576.1 hypothetical protein [Candidatus Woesearchaeota archaeon]MBT4717690.1 hypothetical protein [Candidatus Woesearchaeota archaeon]MBT7106724.1 hypothetical protein [Candidatus Woesearchaeota archaeon]
MSEEKKEYKVKELKVGMNDITIEVEIDMVAPRQKYWEYGEMPRITTIVKDDSGDIKLTLFGEENVKKAKEGLKLRIIEGYVTEFRDQLQLNTKKDKPVEWL